MMGSDFESQGEQEYAPAQAQEPVPQPAPMYQPAPQPIGPPPMGPPPMAAPMKPQTMKPVIAGVLLIVVALMGIIMAIVVMGYVDIGLGMMDEYFVDDPTGTVTGVAEMVQNIVTVCGVIFLIFSILALLGGLMAILRKSWGFAVVGAIFGLLTIGPYGLGAILSIVALILIAISKDEF